MRKESRRGEMAWHLSGPEMGAGEDDRGGVAWSSECGMLHFKACEFRFSVSGGEGGWTTSSACVTIIRPRTVAGLFYI